MFNSYTRALVNRAGDFALPSLLDNVDSMLTNALSDLSGRFELKEDKDGNYYLEFPLPGYKQSDITIDIKDQLLSIKAKNEKRGEKSSSVKVWAEIDEAAVKATLEDGLLIVTLPKKEALKPRRIKVTVRDGTID